MPHIGIARAWSTNERGQGNQGGSKPTVYPLLAVESRAMKHGHLWSVLDLDNRMLDCTLGQLDYYRHIATLRSCTVSFRLARTRHSERSCGTLNMPGCSCGTLSHAMTCLLWKHDVQRKNEDHVSVRRTNLHRPRTDQNY